MSEYLVDPIPSDFSVAMFAALCRLSRKGGHDMLRRRTVLPIAGSRPTRVARAEIEKHIGRPITAEDILMAQQIVRTARKPKTSTAPAVKADKADPSTVSRRPASPISAKDRNQGASDDRAMPELQTA